MISRENASTAIIQKKNTISEPVTSNLVKLAPRWAKIEEPLGVRFAAISILREMLKRCCSSPGVMNAADQQVSADFTSLNLFQAVIRPSGWQRKRAKRQLSESLAGGC